MPTYPRRWRVGAAAAGGPRPGTSRRRAGTTSAVAAEIARPDEPAVVFLARDAVLLPREAVDLGQHGRGRAARRRRTCSAASTVVPRRAARSARAAASAAAVLRERVVEVDDLDALGGEDLHEGVGVGAVALGDADDPAHAQPPGRGVDPLDPGAAVQGEAAVLGLGHEGGRVGRR